MRVSLKTSVIILGLLLVIGFLNVSKESVTSAFFTLTREPASQLWSAGKDVSRFLSGVFSSGSLHEEYVALREENLALRQLVIEADDLRGELNELREAFRLEAREGFQLLAAEIYGKRTGEEVLLISKGSSEGVRVGMVALMGSGVLVGRVTRVLDSTSELQMISSKGVSFDAIVQGSQASGVLRGEGGGRLLLDLVPQNRELNEGDTVSTSNVAEIFPENLLVGRVTKVKGADVEAFWQGEVSWFFDLSATDQVFLIQ